MAILSHLQARWSQPVDPAGLILIRRLFGLVMTVEMVRYLSMGWVHRYYVEPDFHFSVTGLEWLQPAGLEAMTSLFVIVGVCAAAMFWGTFSRVAAGIFVLGFGSIFLMDQTYYQNHLYLVLLVGLYFALVELSPDRLASRWMIDLLRVQVGVVYIFGGLAKINADWLAGEPMTQWMALRADWPVIGSWLAMDGTGVVMAWAGLFVDLAIVPLLMFTRTRWVGFALAVLFHLFNSVLFKIGIFPVMMVVLTTVFLPPSWCRRRRPCPSECAQVAPWIYPVVVVWMLSQVVIPARSWVLPGHTSWTELGHRFSWRMKLRSKVGRVTFHALDKERGTHKVIDPGDGLTAYQNRKMATRPALILKYAHHLASELESEGSGQWAVHVDSRVSLNGRTAQTFIDPAIDLAQETACGQEKWLVPLQN